MRIFLISLIFVFLFLPPALAAEKILNVQKLKTPAGIEVWLVNDKTVPVIAMTFSFNGGLTYDPDSLPGVGRMVSILLDEGAGDLKSQPFQAELSRNAIQMRFTAGRDAFTGRLKTLRTSRTKAFDLLRLAINKPRFDGEAIERMRNANVADIKDNLNDPSWLVARVFNGRVFDGHAYSRPGLGTLNSMANIGRDNLIDFIHAQFARDVLKVAIAGDISADEAVKLVDSVFGSLPARAKPVDQQEALLSDPGKTILLPFDAPQTYILAGEGGISRQDPEWHAAQVMNYILGGQGMDSRLMKEIREKRGLTYGVYTSLPSMTWSALIQASMSVSNENVAEALRLMKQEWAKLAKEGPTSQEVSDAKAYLTGSLLLGLTSTDDIADVLNGLQRDGFDYNYINERNAAIMAVTDDDVRRVSERLLKPENLTVALVGRPEKVTADIMIDRPPAMGEVPPP